MLAPAKGTALRTHKSIIRFAGGAKGEVHGGSKLTQGDVVRVRKLLRTDMSIAEIARELAVDCRSLQRFIRRRNLCDMAERGKFIKLKRSSAGEPIE